MLPDMTQRAHLSERMDDPDCSEKMLLRTIEQFTSVNLLVSRYRTILSRWVLKDMMRAPGKDYHLVDMGAGGCDIDAWLVKKARAIGLKLRITACDLDPRIADYARRKYGHIEGITIREHDLLRDHFDQPVDYVFANHFLHHLEKPDIIRLLRHWHPLVQRRMVLSDLERHPLAYLGFSVFSLAYRNSFTRPDGLTSIRRGFKAGELLEYAREALPQGVNRVHRVFPGRLVLCIEGGHTG
jgi:2-polyprenyl-3-methyl-5-hydroxy-6-metoxy-1,4-benzoquinol methylase